MLVFSNEMTTIYQIVKVNLKFLFFIKMNNLSYIYEMITIFQHYIWICFCETIAF